jgi:hypothetical protein
MPNLTVSDTLGLLSALDDAILLRWLIRTGGLKIQFPKLVPPPPVKDILKIFELTEWLPLSVDVVREQQAEQKKKLENIDNGK